MSKLATLEIFDFNNQHHLKCLIFLSKYLSSGSYHMDEFHY